MFYKTAKKTCYPYTTHYRSSTTGFEPVPIDFKSIILLNICCGCLFKNGTRGWIRTNKSWSQSPLPYLLATRVYGPSGEVQTLGLVVPNHAFYQLNYTRKYGTPYWTQTSDTRFRRPLLYSPELTRHTKIQQFSDMLRSW